MNTTVSSPTTYATGRSLKYLANEQLVAAVSHYAQGGNVALSFYMPDGEPAFTATVNLEGLVLEPRYVAIKNWSENEGMENFLYMHGFIAENPIHYHRSGFVNVPVYACGPELLKLLSGVTE